jgi:formate dehydrogenase subunit beta
MTGLLTVQAGAEDALRDLLAGLLRSGRVEGALVLRALEGGGFAYSLVAGPEALASARPLTPLMPANGGKVLSNMTQEEGFKGTVAAVLRPCEVRAFKELAKRNKGTLDNLVLISSTCGGVLPFQASRDDGLDKALEAYWRAVAAGKLPEGVRPVCRGCTLFEPTGVDMTVRLVGTADLGERAHILLATERAAKLVNDLDGLRATVEDATADGDRAALDAMAALRCAERDAMSAQLATTDDGMRGFIDTFGRCIGCHACSKVCPICYCQMCYFESQASGYDPSWWRHDLERKGATRVPPGTVFYHVGRLLHMGISCVACGMCEDVCPVDIPIARLFKKVGESIQDIFGYVPGRDVTEEIPVRTFEEQELKGVAR